MILNKVLVTTSQALDHNNSEYYYLQSGKFIFYIKWRCQSLQSINKTKCQIDQSAASLPHFGAETALPELVGSFLELGLEPAVPRNLHQEVL